MKLKILTTVFLAGFFSIASVAQNGTGNKNLAQERVMKLKEKQFDMTTVNQPKQLNFDWVKNESFSNSNANRNSESDNEHNDIVPYARLETEFWGVLNSIENNNNIYFSTERNGTNFSITTYDEDFNIDDNFSITVPESANQVQLVDHYSTDYFNNDATREFMVYVHHFDPEIMGPEGQIWEVWIVNSDGDILGKVDGNAAFAKFDNNNNKILYSFKSDQFENIIISAYDPSDFELIDVYTIDSDLSNFYMGMPFDFVTVNGQKYLMVSHYESLFMDNMTMEVFPDNHLIVKLLDYDFQEVKSMSFEIESRYNDLGEFVIPMAEFGTFFTNSDKNFNISEDIFNSDSKLEVLYGVYYYDMIQDAEWSTYRVADEDGEIIHELNEFIVGVNPDILEIDGEDTQVAFLYGENEPEATQLGFFDVESWSFASTFDAVHLGDQLSDKFNRIPYENTYHYLIGIGSPDDVDGNTYGVINEYTKNGDLHERHQLYIPENVELFQPILTSTVLTPNLFTEENDELHFLYVYLERMSEGHITNNLIVARDAENILVEFRGDGIDGNITSAGVGMNYAGTKIDNFYITYEAGYSSQFVDFYKLPFIQSLGVEDFEQAELSVYPNPSKGVFNFNANAIVKDIKVYNYTGKLILNQKVNNTQSAINISSLAKGIYIAQVSLEDGSTKNIKLIKN